AAAGGGLKSHGASEALILLREKPARLEGMSQETSPSRAALLAPYAVVPAAALAIAWDRLVREGPHWQSLVVDEARLMALFLIVFDFPHVIASLFSFGDREYLAAYRRPLVVVGAIALGVAVGLRAAGLGEWALVLVGIANVYHLLMQQIGIG